jgi:Na+/melibiose symporter-like transporter
LSFTSATRNQTPRQGRFGRIKDWLLYVAIAVLIVISVWMFAMHQARTGGSPNLPLKWLGFAGMTAIVFGYAIRASPRSWGKQKFWVLLGLFFAVHSGLGVFVLLRVPTAPLVLYAVLTGIEYVFLASYLGFFLDS